ncbi:hypothetical protein [Schaalia hyovaginalis]|uniref:hypothetical protein n=1 Tax=Schaalia hyovaginalis TaxID=29316 RepID=UPI002A74A21D|nr:hypothetical protein [Schaalia hyovaginalis]MDY2669349.1 hypothetical protein [Schaalia hyovaginalis]
MRYDMEDRTNWYQWWKRQITNDRQASIFLVDTMNHWDEIFLEEAIEERASLIRPSEPEWSPIDWAGEFEVFDKTDPQEIRETRKRLEETIMKALWEQTFVSLCVITGMAEDAVGSPWRESDFDPTYNLEQLMSLVRGDNNDLAAHWMLNHGPVDTETILVWFMMWWLDRPLPQGLVEMPPLEWPESGSTTNYYTALPLRDENEKIPFSQWVNDLILNLAQRKGLDEEDIRELAAERREMEAE